MGEQKETDLKVSIAVRCTAELRDDLETLALDDRRTTSNYIRMVLERHVESEKAARARESEPAAA